MNAYSTAWSFRWIIALCAATAFILSYSTDNNYAKKFEQNSCGGCYKNARTVEELFAEIYAKFPQSSVAKHISNSTALTKSAQHPVGMKSENTLLENVRNVTPTPFPNINPKNEKSSLCPEKSSLSVGFQPVKEAAPNFDELEQKLGPSLQGGGYKPPNCQSRRKMAIIVPFRDRNAHLRAFLQHMHPFLQRQQAEYAILVVEQGDSASFNRGKLLNVGAVEALEQFPYDCLIFHDVDLLPENDRTLYTCKDKPLNFIGKAAKGKRHQKPYYPTYFGGVAAISKKDLYKVNGFSNEYWGWGGEDDDMYRRFCSKNVTCMRYAPSMAPYRMLEHLSSKPNPLRYKLLAAGKKRMETDGLRSLKYRRLKIEKRLLYTWILVDLQYSNNTERMYAKIEGINIVQT